MKLENYCTKCGKEIMQSQKYCANCGSYLAEEVTHNSKLSIWESLKNRKGIVIISTIIAVLLIVFAMRGSQPSPVEVAEQFIIHTKNENYDEAQKLWSQSGIDYMLSMLGDERWIYQNMRNFTHRTDSQLSDYQFTSEEKIDQDNVTLYAEFSFDNGISRTAKMAMTRESGEWKVFAFDTY